MNPMGNDTDHIKAQTPVSKPIPGYPNTSPGICRTSSRRATSSSVGLPFICKIVKSLCHKNPARRTYLHECHYWGWLPGRRIISGPGRKVSSSSSCRYCILKPAFPKLSPGYVVSKKWFSSKSRHNTAPWWFFTRLRGHHTAPSAASPLF